jgi:hypothetical protein
MSIFEKLYDALPAMKQPVVGMLLAFGLSVTANADIWKWVDEDGNVHFGDTPAREYAATAELVRYTSGNRSASTSSSAQTDSSRGEDIDPQRAQAHYCNRAKEIYRSYADAPRLYRTSEDGRREYLSDQEAADALAEAEASVAEWCN